MKTEIVSFYADISPCTYYSDHYKRLKLECEKHNIPYDFRNIESQEDYRLNCLRKPKFIAEMLEEKGRAIAWLDIDSTVHSTLEVLDTLMDKVDIGFAYPGINAQDIVAKFPKASPIFCNYTDNALDFLDKWIEECEKSRDSTETLFDHEVLLFRVLPRLIQEKKIKIAALPIQYCVWPGKCPAGIEPVITMGIADHKAKEKDIRKLASQHGMDESLIQLNLNKI